MAHKSSSKKISVSLSHLPTAMLIIGYSVYWLELYCHRNNFGQTSFLATGIFVLLSVYCLFQKRVRIISSIHDTRSTLNKSELYVKIFISLGCLISVFLLSIALYAHLLAPHLVQEFDIFNYHYTLPRQHLILNSFQHIRWSSMDLVPLPLQFALSPYWFVTELPNKFPQFLFLLGVLFVSLSLAKKLSRHPLNIWIVLFAILGTHSVGIQMGTAMLDLVICYLFLASLDSFLKGKMILSAVEFSFYFWAKSFIPLQVILIILAISLIWILLRKINFSFLAWGFYREVTLKKTNKQDDVKKFLFAFCIFSFLIGGPFVAKSLHYSGTPLFPFAPRIFQINPAADGGGANVDPIVEASRAHIKTKDIHGYGRSFQDFLKHFWLMAVPDEGVNNKFDYPVGLPYLLFVGSFFYFCFCSFRRRQFPILPLFILTYWAVWWFGSQQTRFLYIPFILMYIVTSSELKMPSFVLKGVILLALLINSVSIIRAHKHDFGLPTQKILRGKDLKLISQNELYVNANRSDVVDLSYGDVAFAQFPVNVTKGNLPFIIKY